MTIIVFAIIFGLFSVIALLGLVGEIVILSLENLAGKVFNDKDDRNEE